MSGATDVPHELSMHVTSYQMDFELFETVGVVSTELTAVHVDLLVDTLEVCFMIGCLYIYTDYFC